MDIKTYLMNIRTSLIRTMPYRRRGGWLAGSAIILGFAALLGFAAFKGAGPEDRSKVLLLAAVAAGFSAYGFWRATRFRIARGAENAGGALTLSSPHWSVTLQPSDVKQVVQLRLDPYAFGFTSRMPYRAWREWLRVDATTGDTRTRRYLVWRADASAFLERLREAGFQVSGEGAWNG